MSLELSERQRATVATAITIVAAFVIVCALGLIFYLLGIFVARFSNVFLPLAVAAVIAFYVFHKCHPYHVCARSVVHRSHGFHAFQV